MSATTPDGDRPTSLADARAESMRRATEIAVRLGLLAAIALWCFQIVAPFIGIVLWGLIIAIAATTPYEAVVRALGGRRGLAATLLVTLSLAVIVVPAVMLSETLISGAQHFAKDVSAGTFALPPPPERVAEWPIVGKQLFDTWSMASQNLEAALSQAAPQLKAVSSWLLGAAGSAGSRRQRVM